MSEPKPNSAAKIIRYCNERDMQSYLLFDLYAHVDLPRVTRDAVELRKELSRIAARGIITSDTLLDDTKYLEDGE